MQYEETEATYLDTGIENNNLIGDLYLELQHIMGQ